MQGTGIVHLTGYNIQDPGEEPLGFGDEDDYSSEDEAAEVEEIPALVNGKKRKAGASGDEATPATKKRNERKAAIEMAKKIANTIKVRLLKEKCYCSNSQIKMFGRYLQVQLKDFA